MEDNLIYNGDFSKGIDSWSGSGITAENGIITLTGDLIQDAKYLIPISPKKRYKISFDIKFNNIPSDSDNFYLAFMQHDYDLNHYGSRQVLKQEDSNITNTVLAEPLKKGDTYAVLKSTTYWTGHEGAATRYLGICDNPKWGYFRSDKLYRVSDTNPISENKIFFESIYNNDTTYPIGTKVAEFRAGSKYIYPIYFSVSNITVGEWIHKEAIWYQEDRTSVKPMYSCRYIRMRTLGYSMNYSIKNLKMIDEDGAQKNIFEDNIITTPHKNGTVTSAFLEQPETSDAKILYYGNLVSSEFKEV